jgi:L-fuconolactonase
MLITDSQVHIWGANTPERPWPKRQAAHKPEPLTAALLLEEMNEAGVHRAVIVPPGWEGERNDLALAAARTHPDRFAVMGRLDVEDPAGRAQLPAWKSQPGMLGIRLTFHTEWQEPLLTEGRLDWFWPVAAKAGINLMILVPHRLVPLIAAVAERHPDLRIVMDHLAIPSRTKDAAAFEGLPELLKLARRPNVAVKATGMPCYSSEPYPYRNLHEPLRRVYDAFGPRRMFWGTDLSRLTCSYRQAVTLFTEELEWLSAEDKEWIMGRGVCEWLGWELPKVLPTLRV